MTQGFLWLGKLTPSLLWGSPPSGHFQRRVVGTGGRAGGWDVAEPGPQGGRWGLSGRAGVAGEASCAAPGPGGQWPGKGPGPRGAGQGPWSTGPSAAVIKGSGRPRGLMYVRLN